MCRRRVHGEYGLDKITLGLELLCFFELSSFVQVLMLSVSVLDEATGDQLHLLQSFLLVGPKQVRINHSRCMKTELDQHNNHFDCADLLILDAPTIWTTNAIDLLATAAAKKWMIHTNRNLVVSARRG